MNIFNGFKPSQSLIMYMVGFIQTKDGRELYFHKNSLLNAGFEEVEVGNEVRFVEENGDEGPQASSIRVVGRS